MSYKMPILVVSLCLLIFFGAWIVVSLIEMDYEAQGDIIVASPPRITIIESTVPQNNVQIAQMKQEIASLKKTVENKDSEKRYTVQGYTRYYSDYDDYYYDRDHYDRNYYDDRYNSRYYYQDHYFRYDDEWDLIVYVEDEDGEPIDDARVHVEDGDSKTRYTDSDGRARFYDLEDDCYDIEVDADGYDDYDDDFCLHRDRRITVELRD